MSYGHKQTHKEYKTIKNLCDAMFSSCSAKMMLSDCFLTRLLHSSNALEACFTTTAWDSIVARSSSRMFLRAGSRLTACASLFSPLAHRKWSISASPANQDTRRVSRLVEQIFQSKGQRHHLSKLFSWPTIVLHDESLTMSFMARRER